MGKGVPAYPYFNRGTRNGSARGAAQRPALVGFTYAANCRGKLRLVVARHREFLASRRDLPAFGEIGAAPGDALVQIGEVRLHRYIVQPRFDFIVVPLSKAERRANLQDAAAHEEPGEKIGPGVGIAVDVD